MRYVRATFPLEITPSARFPARQAGENSQTVFDSTVPSGKVTPMQARPPLIVYVDVDDTLVRSVGTKRVPMPAVIAHVRDLFNAGAELYCWSTGGADYARASAIEVGLGDCFRAFLPKPQVVIDDQALAEWRRLVQVSPLSCATNTISDYSAALER